MTPQQRKNFKDLIESEIKRLKNELSVTEKDANPTVSPDNAIGRISRVEAMQNRRISEASFYARKMRVGRLEQALLNVEGEDYGYCQECEEAIPIGRMRLIPEATLCVTCASSQPH